MMGNEKEMNCGVAKWVKFNTLRWIGHVKKRQDEEFTRRIYDSMIKGVNVTRRPPDMGK